MIGAEEMGSRGVKSASAKVKKSLPLHFDKKKKGHEIFSDEDATVEGIAKYLGVSMEEAKSFDSAIWSFTGDYFTAIRQLQNGKIPEGFDKNSPFVKAMKEKGENLEKYIEKAPKWNGGETYRGINISSEDLKKYQVGNTIDVNRGTASWSSDIKVSKKFAKQGSEEKVVFKCPTQKNGTSIKHLSNYNHEDEVMVSKNSKYVITSINRNKDGIIYVNIKEK